MSDPAGCPAEHRWQDFLLRCLSADDLTQLAAHLQDCSACRATVARLTPQMRTARPGEVAEVLTLDVLCPPGHDAPIPSFVGPYEVRGLLGEGGMGRVYRAYDPALGRVVAVKVMAETLAAVPAARQRFLREARAAAAVIGDHIVAVHAVEGDAAVPYLVMQYVKGESLQQRLDGAGPPEAKEVVRIGLEVARGLATAHARGVIHRDVKPANILLEEGTGRVRLTDFGLARVRDDVHVSKSGQVVGTPLYMSPEQARGEMVDPRTDLFSLGSVLYALCTGQPPFRPGTAMATLKSVCDDTPPPIGAQNPAVPDLLAAVVVRLLAKDPAERFQTAEELADLLERYLAHLSQPDVVPAPRRPAVPGPRRRSWLLAGGAMALLGVVILVAALAGSFRSKPAATDATLTLDVRQPGTVVSIDGEGAPFTLMRRFERPQVQRFTLAPGRYRIRAACGAEVLFERTLNLEAGVEWKQTLGEPADDPPRLRPRTVLRGHTGGISWVGFAPDGRTPVSSGEDPPVRRWDHPDRPFLYGQLTDSPAAVVAFSPDGRWMATGHYDGRVRLWDPRASKRVREWPVFAGIVSAVAIAPDGKRLAAGGGVNGTDYRVHLFAVPSGEPLGQLEGHTHIVYSAAFSRDGQRLLTASQDGTAVVWELATRKAADTFEHPAGVRFAAWSPDGRRVATVGLFPVVRLWEPGRAGQPSSFRVGPADTHLYCVRWSPDGRHLLTGGTDGQVRVWEVDNGRPRAVLAGHTGLVRHLALSPDGKTLLSGGADRTVHVWDVGALWAR